MMATRRSLAAATVGTTLGTGALLTGGFALAVLLLRLAGAGAGAAVARAAAGGTGALAVVGRAGAGHFCLIEFWDLVLRMKGDGCVVMRCKTRERECVDDEL